MTDAATLMEPTTKDLLQKWLASKFVNNSRADEDDVTSIQRNSP
jgi:hypothetical protein